MGRRGGWMDGWMDGQMAGSLHALKAAPPSLPGCTALAGQPELRVRRMAGATAMHTQLAFLLLVLRYWHAHVNVLEPTATALPSNMPAPMLSKGHSGREGQGSSGSFARGRVRVGFRWVGAVWGAWQQPGQRPGLPP
eukprot:365214-Chlamydomonas_euryale.AAC.22